MAKDLYIQALEDLEELLRNARDNWDYSETAPWYWDFEMQDLIIELKDNHDQNY